LSAAVREAYGRRSGFGQGCLLARRLVQTGVRFVEVELGGWDTHQDNFDSIERKAPEMDKAVSTLIQDLIHKGLYDRTVVLLLGVWSHKDQPQPGRDHFPQVGLSSAAAALSRCADRQGDAGNRRRATCPRWRFVRDAVQALGIDHRD
jgi:hypothetical protein